MINKNRIIKNIQKNIALSNFEKEIISNENNKNCTQKSYRRIYDMKKMILAASCCSIMLIGGIVYAYNNNYFKLSNNFLIKDSNYYESMPEDINNDTEEDEIKENNRAYLNGYFIAGLFGKRIDKFSNIEYDHNGIDIAAPKGTKVLAVAGGRIKETNYNSEYGNYIIIENDEEYETLYAHLDKINVKEGYSISQGEEIGTVGYTGNVVGPCLHLELHHNGEPVNPLDYIDKIKE